VTKEPKMTLHYYVGKRGHPDTAVTFTFDIRGELQGLVFIGLNQIQWL